MEDKREEENSARGGQRTTKREFELKWDAMEVYTATTGKKWTWK